MRFDCAFPLPELPLAAVDSIDLRVLLAPTPEVASAFSGSLDPPADHDTVLGDGRRYFVERGISGDYRIEYGDRARFHLDAGGSTLLCAPTNIDDPAFRRFLLDTALGTAALVNGFEALHAAAYVGATGVVAIAAGTGGGKSSLLAEMVQRGSTVMCDDVLALSRADTVVLGQPGPPLLNLPPTLPDGTPSAQLGCVIADVDGEHWIAVDRPAVVAAPVSAVVVLQRAHAAPLELVPLAANPIVLLPHALTRGPTQEHVRARFELFADLATQARLFTLTAPTRAPTAATADLLAGL